MTTPLYGHYTPLPGLMGIIKDETLWATNIKFLNDEHEFKHAIDLIKTIVKNAKITKDHSDYTTYQNFKSNVDLALEHLSNYDTESIFTLSFSAETDLLSQWRGYCPENNGYCIIFDLNELFEDVKSKFEKCHLVQCVYDAKDKETKLKNVLNDYWQKYLKTRTKKEKNDLFTNLADELMLLASFFKHPSFEEEQEHRIVVILPFATDEDLQFREGRFSLIPYIKLSAPRKTIKKICIGPTVHKELAKRALETFLEKSFGFPVTTFDDLEITFSSTPYRPW